MATNASLKTPAARSTGTRRALDVLLMLEDAHKRGGVGLGVTQVAEMSGIDKSQASRTLQVLAEYGLVDRDPRSRAYRLGWKIFELAQSAGEQNLIASSGLVLDQLLPVLDESVYVSVRSGYDAVTVDGRDANHSIQATVQHWTVDQTAVGRVLLGDLTRDDIRGLSAGRTIRSAKEDGVQSIDDLCAEVEKVREQGYSVVIDEFEVGLLAIAAPVRDHHDSIIAALGVSGPTFRLVDRVDEAIDAIVNAAHQLETSLRDRSAIGRAGS